MVNYKSQLLISRIFDMLIRSLQKKRRKLIIPYGVEIRRYDLVEIGQNVTFGGECRIFNKERVSIGSDCMVAYGVQIITSTHDHNNHPMSIERIDRPVKIGNHVWIGTNAIILPGVIISDYAVIGAGSVVTSNVPESAIVAGIPARILKYRGCDNQWVPCEGLSKSISRGYLDQVCR